MGLVEEMQKAQGRLSKVNVDFMKFIEQNPEGLSASNYNLLELNDDLFVLQSWPTFLGKTYREEFEKATLQTYDLIRSIPRRVFKYDTQKMSEYFGVTVKEIERHLEGVNEKHLDTLLGRGDYVLSEDGLKCVEFNVTPNFGGWQVTVWESLYLNVPIISRFLKQHRIQARNQMLVNRLFDHLINCGNEYSSKTDEEINVALVVPEFSTDNPERVVLYFQQLYQMVLKQKFKEKKGDFVVCDYYNLDLVDDHIFYQGKKIHALVEVYGSKVSSKVMEAFKKGNLCLMNGAISDLLSYKLNLAILHDWEYQSCFSEEERETIKTYIPWTYKVANKTALYRGDKKDLIPFIRENRETLVLKPSDGYGGNQVTIGKKTTPQEWEEVLDKALKDKSWLVQELVNTAPFLYQVGKVGYSLHDATWGFFVFGSNYGGAFLRILPNHHNKGVINCRQGATVSGILDVDE
jgi:hypothetical protein